MKCRNLSEKNHNIIWFGKDFENFKTVQYYGLIRTCIRYTGVKNTETGGVKQQEIVHGDSYFVDNPSADFVHCGIGGIKTQANFKNSAHSSGTIGPQGGFDGLFYVISSKEKFYFTLNNVEIDGTDLYNYMDQTFVYNKTTYYCKFDYDTFSNDVLNGAFYTSKASTIPVGTCYLITPKTTNYVEDTDAVVASLIQRLSVIKGELWWQVNYGMPLTDKVRGTTLYDMVVTDIITSHPGVASIQSYSSNLVGHTYTYTCTIKTVFGDTATISN